MADLLDFAASRRTRTRCAANLATALEEADNLETETRCMLAQARAAALMGFDAEDEIVTLRASVQRLAAQLAFAEALAHRARRRAAPRREPEAANG